MKLYTDKSQTAKLIELGFEKPKSSVECELPKGDWRIGAVGIRKAYSIGELLSFLPQSMDFDDGAWSLSIEADPFKVNGTWWVFYEPSHHTESAELIDAIFAMVVKLKEEGEI